MVDEKQQETKEDKKDVVSILKELKEKYKRNFTQSVDLIINLKNIDLRKPENRFSKEIFLPHGRGKEIKVCIISDKIKGAVSKSEIEKYDKKKIRKFIRQYDFFLCDVKLMPFIGKALGKFLGPLGKMPTPIPPNMDNPEPLVNAKKKTIRVRLSNSPVIHAIVGSESMPEEQIRDNILKVISEVEAQLPKGSAQIKDVFIKLTMSPAMRIDIYAEKRQA